MGHQTTDGTMDNPQSINALAAAGVSKMRKTIWANKMDHLLIVIRDGKPTIWSYLFCPMNKSLSGRDPLPLCAIEMDFDKAEWLPYTGPDAESAEYLAEREGSNIPLPIRWWPKGHKLAERGAGWYVTWDGHALQPADGPRGWLPIPTEWLPETEPQWQQYAQKAHDVDGHCDVVLVADLKRASAPSAAPAGIEDPVTVPRGLLGAACAAIDRKHDAPKTLAALRRYTVGDLSATTPNQSVSAQLLHALTLLLSYTKACEGLLNCKPAGQIEIAEKAIEAASRGGSY